MEKFTIKDLRDYLNDLPEKYDNAPVMAFHEENGEGTGIYMDTCQLIDEDLAGPDKEVYLTMQNCPED